jgi:hypothetical protein
MKTTKILDLLKSLHLLVAQLAPGAAADAAAAGAAGGLAAGMKEPSKQILFLKKLMYLNGEQQYRRLLKSLHLLVAQLAVWLALLLALLLTVCLLE